jgi:hypothetical protein
MLDKRRFEHAVRRAEGVNYQTGWKPFAFLATQPHDTGYRR